MKGLGKRAFNNIADTTSNTTVDASRQSPPVKTARSTPLYELRKGYLWVSDLLSQAWCEQQMFYKLTTPIAAPADPVIKAGSELHLARGQ